MNHCGTPSLIKRQDSFNEDVQIQHLTDCVNLLSENMSVFNNNNDHSQRNKTYASHPSIVSLQSTPIENFHNEHHSLITPDYEDDVTHGRDINVQQGFNAVSHTFVSILTKALETVNGELLRPQIASTNGDLESIPNSINSAILSLEEYALQQNLDNKQKIAFKAICASFMLSFLSEMSGELSTVDMQQFTILLQRNGAVQQLLMCVTGPGGSGKSHVIKCCRMYCKMFCDAIGKPFNFSVFPITATTNAAAALLQGCTIHSAALLNKSVVQIEFGCDVNWPMTKILIIDEISMATSSLFKSLDKNLRILTGNRRLLYGGIHIVFTGDFMQLAPVQGTPIYQNFDDYFWHQCLNSAIFLDERNHRFINDPLWGEILQRCQLGVPTDQDINTINARLLGTVVLPNNEQNKDVGPEFHKLLWALCGDDNLTVGNSCKVDPCLKLIKGIPLMVNTNTGKENRIVKGIIGDFVGVIWKHQCNAHVEDYLGYKVQCAYVSDIEFIVLRLHVDGRLVHISPEMFHPVIKFPGCNNMNVLKGYTIQQFPVNVSLAITGHKLQGMTVDILILSEIHLTQNWLYVLLSRVTSLNGLYLMKPLGVAAWT